MGSEKEKGVHVRLVCDPANNFTVFKYLNQTKPPVFCFCRKQLVISELESVLVYRSNPVSNSSTLISAIFQ